MEYDYIVMTACVRYIYLYADEAELGAVGPSPRVATAQDMNGAIYGLSNAPGVDPMSLLRNTNMFEVFSWPVTTRFGAVYHKELVVQLPDSIVREFASRDLAIRGWEADYVLTSEVPDGNATAATTGSSIPYKMTTSNVGPTMPASWLYNHHWKFFFPEAHTIDAETPYFNEGNGGEHKASFHGFPAGRALVIRSPRTFKLEVMIIDTHNRSDSTQDGAWIGAEGMFSASTRSRYDSLYGMISCPCARVQAEPFENPCMRNHGVHTVHPKLQHNPTCDQRTYTGGSKCCVATQRQGASLLHAGEYQPLEEMTSRLRLRFYYEDYVPASPTSAASHSYLTKLFIEPAGNYCSVSTAWRCQMVYARDCLCSPHALRTRAPARLRYHG